MNVLPEERLMAHVLCQVHRCWRCWLWPVRQRSPWWRDDPIAQRLHFHRKDDCPRCGRRKRRPDVESPSVERGEP